MLYLLIFQIMILLKYTNFYLKMEKDILKYNYYKRILVSNQILHLTSCEHLVKQALSEKGVII